MVRVACCAVYVLFISGYQWRLGVLRGRKFCFLHVTRGWVTLNKLMDSIVKHFTAVRGPSVEDLCYSRMVSETSTMLQNRLGTPASDLL